MILSCVKINSRDTDVRVPNGNTNARSKKTFITEKKKDHEGRGNVGPNQ